MELQLKEVRAIFIFRDISYLGSFKCHGWASGPTPWLTEHVLGIKVIEPGCRAIEVKPHLGDLKFAEGSFPTPYGLVKVKHIKLSNGKIQSDISAPKEVKIIR